MSDAYNNIVTDANLDPDTGEPLPKCPECGKPTSISSGSYFCIDFWGPSYKSCAGQIPRVPALIACIEKLRESTAHLENDTKLALQGASEVNDKLVVENGRLRERVEELIACKQSDERQIISLSNRLADQDLRTELEDAQRELFALRNENDLRGRTNRHLHDTLARKNKEIEDLRADRSLSVQGRDELNKALVECRQTCAEQHERIVELEADAERFGKQATLLQAALQDEQTKSAEQMSITSWYSRRVFNTMNYLAGGAFGPFAPVTKRQKPDAPGHWCGKLFEYAKKTRDERDEAQKRVAELERERDTCNGSCDIALARRQVGPDGIVPGNARECAEAWEREAARLCSVNKKFQDEREEATERAEKAERERDEARAACAAMTRFVDEVRTEVTRPYAKGETASAIRKIGHEHLSGWLRSDFNPAAPILAQLEAGEVMYQATVVNGWCAHCDSQDDKHLIGCPFAAYAATKGQP